LSDHRAHSRQMKRRWNAQATSSGPNGSQSIDQEQVSGTCAASARPRQGETPSNCCRNGAASSVSGFRRLQYTDRGRLHEINLDVEAALPAPTYSTAATEYIATLRAHYLRDAGCTSAKTAAKLHRTEAEVERWWQIAPSDLARPRDIPPYICTYELRMMHAGVEPFRGAELRRKYVPNASGLYAECVQGLPWQQAMVRQRNYQTGDLAVTSTASNRQDCVLRGTRTGIPRLDDVLRRVRDDFRIEDPRAFMVNNWYPDGRSGIGAHNHDHWSAILSFGSSRVFLLDDKPILLGDGDLLVFGTQRHGLPKMPAVAEGRVSIAIFWYPEQRGTSASASRGGEACAGCGMQDVLLQEAPDGNSYCEICWATILERSSHRTSNQLQAAEDDMLAIALQMSLVEQ